MKKTIRLIGVSALLLIVTGCTDPENASRILKAQGMTQVEITGYRFFTCGEGDTYSTGFKAKTQVGHKVSGAVCSGFIAKNSTIRYD